MERLQQDLHEKEYEVEYYGNERRELANTIEDLHNQLGEREFQLHLAEERIK